MSRIAIGKEARIWARWLPMMLYGLGFFVSTSLLPAAELSSHELSQQLGQFINSLNSPQSAADTTEPLQVSESIFVLSCDKYPYHARNRGIMQLTSDLAEGIQHGVACLAGQSEQGALHAYHQQKAAQLLAILNSDQPKLLHCVSDELFAYAMAVSPHQQVTNIALKKKIADSPKLTIFLDTFRIGGLLSKRFDVRTYQDFFKLDDSQIEQHLTSKPLRMKGLHRYQNLPALLFHETVHWLGETHANQRPDLTFLYETCCFGGSEYISNEAVNEGFQQAACQILKDDELWSAEPEQQKKIWKDKGYRNLKTTMRQFY